jgi:hypothetical protein
LVFVGFAKISAFNTALYRKFSEKDRKAPQMFWEGTSPLV